METRQERPLWVRLFWWAVFGAAFGYLEAVIVVYLRRLIGVPPGSGYREILAAHNLTFRPSGIQEELRRHDLLPIEFSREISTLVLLAGAACASGRTARERWGIFGYTFAVWDLTFYLFLTLWSGFPRSLLDTDIFFLVPIPWYGPVWFPVLVCMPLILLLSLRLLRATRQEALSTVQQATSLLGGFWNE